MDISAIDEVERKLVSLFERINSLKVENRGLKREVYSLKTNLDQARITAASGDELRKKYASLVEERERLMMERELIRGKVKSAMERIGELVDAEEGQ